jgi:hypothetical protein
VTVDHCAAGQFFIPSGGRPEADAKVIHNGSLFIASIQSMTYRRPALQPLKRLIPSGREKKMSLTKELLNEINRANAKKSTGPTSRTGKQRSSLNAVKHNLSGQNMIMLAGEREAYNRMGTAMLMDLKPKSEPERQIALKIVDTNFRLNRLTAIENNLFSFGITGAETDCAHDDRIEVMAAQTRAWTEQAGFFDTLGRYESRLSRQLHKYQEEFERLQAVRKEQERIDSHRSRNDIKRDQFDPASFGTITAALLEGPNFYHILSHLPPPEDLQKNPSGADDLVAGVPPTEMAA